MSKTIFLIKKQIYLIHQKALRDFGGDNGCYDNTDGKIESILSQLFSYFGYEKYPSIYEKAAALLYFFTKGHCFIDANKRVGIDSAIVFLSINGYIDNLDDDDGYNKTMEIASIHLSEIERDNYIKDLATWLRKNFKKKYSRK